MPIKLACRCGKQLRLRNHLQGKKVRCPDCGVILQVPGVSSTSNYPQDSREYDFPMEYRHPRSSHNRASRSQNISPTVWIVGGGVVLGLIVLGIVVLVINFNKDESKSRIVQNDENESQHSVTNTFPWIRIDNKILDMSVGSESRIPLYVTPYYDSRGLQIDVGSFSEQLANADAESIGKLSMIMKKEWDTLPIEAMFVLAIRLYDLGKKNEAAYWFYSAKSRAQLFDSTLSPGSKGNFGSEGFGRYHAHLAFRHLAGKFINGYAFGDLPVLEATLKTVITDSKSIPDFRKIYKNLQFIETNSWPNKNRDVISSIRKLLKYIKENAQMIKEVRKKNGMDGKY